MNLLRRATIETARGLGINFPTAFTVILGIGSSIIVVATFPVPVTDTFTIFVVWLIKSVAWISAVLVVFIPLLAWNALKVAERDRSASAHLQMAAESFASVDDQMKSFLRNVLSNPSYGVAKCYAFGSIIRLYPTRDVDIIIQFESSKPIQVRIYRDRLRNVESLFQEFHDLKLHVQTFLRTENEALHRFLNDAGAHERIL